MKVQSSLHGAPQWVVGASSWGPRGRLDANWPDSPLSDSEMRWTVTADGASARTLLAWLDESSQGSASSGRCADGAGKSLPRRQPGECRRQVQDDPTDRALDPHGELEQPLAQRRDLRRGTAGARRSAPQLLEEHVRRQREQDAKLVGEELLATGSVHLQPVMQFLEPVLHVPPSAVELVDRLRLVREVRHHEARVVLRVAPRMAHDLGLDDHPALALPASGGIPRLAIQMRRLPGDLGQHPGFAHQPPRALLQARVAGHRHDVLDLLLLQALEQRRVPKPSIQAYPKRSRPKGG